MLQCGFWTKYYFIKCDIYKSWDMLFSKISAYDVITIISKMLAVKKKILCSSLWINIKFWHLASLSVKFWGRRKFIKINVAQFFACPEKVIQDKCIMKQLQSIYIHFVSLYWKSFCSFEKKVFCEKEFST